MTWIDVGHILAVKNGVLFQHDAHGLTSPFCNLYRGIQLNGVSRHRIERVIAAPGYTTLLIPQSDRRAGSVSVQTERMRVDRRLDPFLPCLSQRRTRRGIRVQSLVYGESVAHEYRPLWRGDVPATDPPGQAWLPDLDGGEVANALAARLVPR